MSLLKEVAIKENRIIDYLIENNYEAAIIARRDNFAWLTAGGNNKVAEAQETGFGVLVITLDGRKYLIAHKADIDRIYEEEVKGLGYQPVIAWWYDKSPEAKALELAAEKRILADIPLENTDYRLKDIYDLHYPLTEYEIERYKTIGKEVDKSIARVAEQVEPGMTEIEVQARLLQVFILQNIEVDVMLIGSDERAFNYRHPLPTYRKVKDYLLITPAVKKWGLHVNISRVIHFGEPTAEIKEKYDTACKIAAASIGECIPGNTFSKILSIQKELYHEYGYPEEWKNHYQGGITGYMVADPTRCLDESEKITANQTYEWFITITGVKAAELGFNDGTSQSIISNSGLWPTKTYSYKGKKYNMSDILVK